MITKAGLLAIVFSLAACGGGSSASTPKKVDATVSASAGGSVSPMVASLSAGNSTSFTIAAAEGYSLKNVTGCNGSLQGSIFTTGALAANCSISVEFARNSYEVSLVTGSGGSAAVNKAAVLHGDSWTLALQPEAGYQVGTISGCGAGSVNGNSVTTAPIKANCQLDVQFTKHLVRVTGVVAVGAPLANVKVEAKCQGNSGFAAEVITNSQGAFAGQVAELDLPCALRATSTNPTLSLHGFAALGGRANITSFTDMVLALASGQQPAEWYAGNQIELTGPLLASNVKKLLEIFKSTGYLLPAGEFDPFAGELAIGDEWDKVLDQLSTGLAQTQSASYQQLVANLAQDNYEFPLPNGDQEETAETCFNPELYAEGTKVVTGAHMVTGSTESDINHNVREIELVNISSIAPAGDSVLAQDFSFIHDHYMSDIQNKSTDGGRGGVRKQVNLLTKTVADVSQDYLIDLERSSANQIMSYFSYRVGYDQVGNQIRFRFPKNVRFNESYVFEDDFRFSIIFSPAEVSSQILKSTHSKERYFAGITTLMRGGTSYPVCEFVVSEQKTILPETSNASLHGKNYSETYSQYFMVDTGVEITDPNITSISVNGLEVYSNPVE